MGQWGYNSYSTDSVWDVLDEVLEDFQQIRATPEQIEELIYNICDKVDKCDSDFMLPHYIYTFVGVISWCVSEGYDVDEDWLDICISELEWELENRDDYDDERKQVVADEIELNKKALLKLKKV